MIAIVDYGMANLRSVQKALAAVGHDAVVVSDPAGLRKAERVILPGVGAMADAVVKLRETGLADAVLEHINRGRPFLGICLGLQMLFDVGYENGEHKGLGVLPGAVHRFGVDQMQGLKVPHMGWNTLTIRRPAPIFKGLPDGAGVYFVHGYHAVCQRLDDVATTSDYGGEFTSSVWRDNVTAVQFHPEKSQTVGLQMLANFAGI